MPEKTYDVRYNDSFGEKYRHYEDFDFDGNKFRVEFDRETKIAKNVPEQIALKLSKSEAFAIVDSKSKPTSAALVAPPEPKVEAPPVEPQAGGKPPVHRGAKAKAQ